MRTLLFDGGSKKRSSRGLFLCLCSRSRSRSRSCARTRACALSGDAELVETWVGAVDFGGARLEVPVPSFLFFLVPTGWVVVAVSFEFLDDGLGRGFIVVGYLGD